VTTFTYAPSYFTVLRTDVLSDGKACWLATHPEIDGVYGAGATQGEALHQLERARAAYFTALQKHGRDLPELRQPAVLVVEEIADGRSRLVEQETGYFTDSSIATTFATFG
jgi:predicted RNase H-like HicB family nuclease